LRADRRLVFAKEPDDLDVAWRRLMTGTGVGPSSWTDAYLAAFAESHSFSLVTFDTTFQRWPALNLTLLSSVERRSSESGLGRVISKPTSDL
jgi:predicted nucleic acid-binding protein